MTYAKLTATGTLACPPATIVRPDGTTVIGYNRNIRGIQWLCDHLRLSWMMEI